MPQRFPPPVRAGPCPGLARLLVPVHLAGFNGFVLALLAGLTLGGTGSAQAQGRGTLQVAAQVVSAAPSQLALDAGLSSVGLRAAPATQSLASIRVTRLARAPGPERGVRRPRAILTIAFLSN